MMETNSGVEQAELDVSSMVRTAQVSQLRRRGALRGDRRSLGSRERTLHEDVDFIPDEVVHYSQPFQGRSQGYKIRCGKETNLPTPSSYNAPNGFPLPIASTSLKRKYSESFAPPFSKPSSNGCGEVLDTSAHPLIDSGGWIASYPRFVAPLDDSYLEIVPTSEVALRKIGLLPCGCTRKAFGCVVCGNTLGTYIQPCKRHATSLFTQERVHAPIHSFFRSQISVSPDFRFPQRVEPVPEAQTHGRRNSEPFNPWPRSSEDRAAIRRRLLPQRSYSISADLFQPPPNRTDEEDFEEPQPIPVPPGSEAPDRPSWQWLFPPGSPSDENSGEEEEERLELPRPRFGAVSPAAVSRDWLPDFSHITRFSDAPPSMRNRTRESLPRDMQRDEARMHRRMYFMVRENERQEAVAAEASDRSEGAAAGHRRSWQSYHGPGVGGGEEGFNVPPESNVREALDLEDQVECDAEIA